MAASLNHITLIGKVGKDPETMNFEGGAKRSRFSLATSTYIKSKAGEKSEKTEWHNITFWGALSDVCEKYIRKGASVFVSGRVEYKTWEKDGVKKYGTEIVGQELLMLGNKPTPSEEQDTVPLPLDQQGVPEDPDNDLPF